MRSLNSTPTYLTWLAKVILTNKFFNIHRIQKKLVMDLKKRLILVNTTLINELQQSQTRCKNQLSAKKKELVRKRPHLKNELGIPTLLLTFG